MRPLPSAAANVLVLVACGTAGYVAAGRSWSWPYRVTLLLHPLGSTAAVLALLAYLPPHIREKLAFPAGPSRRGGSRVPKGIVAAAVCASLATLLHPAVAAALCAAAPVGIWLLGRRLPAVAPGSGPLGRASGGLLLLALAATWLTGLPCLAVLDGPPPSWIVRSHHLFGLLVGAAFASHVLPAAARFVLGRARAGDDRRSLAWIAGTCTALFVLGTAAAVWEIACEKRSPSWTARLSTIPTDDALPERQALLAGRERELLALTGGCGRGEGCHPSLVRDFERSAHLVSVRTPHFAKNMDLMAGEIGRRKTLLCAGCHVPVDTLAGNTAFTSMSPEHRGNSCAFCHSVSKAWVDPEDRRRSFYTVAPRLAHLALVDEADPERTGSRARLARLLLRLGIAGHGRALMRPLCREDRLCDACHHLQTPAPPPGRFEGPRCADCHMQSERYLHAEGSAANHYFPGSNTALPYILGDAATLEDVLQWLRGDMPLPLKGWGAFWQLRGPNEDDPTRSVWLRMAAEVIPPVPAGGPYRLRITTANVGMAHRFPAAALDLLEVWQQVEVEDESGRVLFVRGRLDENEDIDPEAHHLGGYMLDPDGHMIERNRVWRIARKVVTRAVDADGHVVDDYDLGLPAARAGGEVRVRAWWNYRFFNRPFTEWAYGEGFHLPVARIGELDVRFRIAGSTGTAASPPAAAARTDESARGRIRE